jgi:glycosyltransferase involved in cell wall biosynthesis
MNEPLITVFMSVKDGASTIKGTIESVIAQTFQDWELLIGDNCSTDETVSIIKSFNDSRIRVIENEYDNGLLYNQMLLRREIKTEYVKGIDDDSYLYPQNLEKELSVLMENKNIAFVTSDMEYITPNGKIISAIVPFRKNIVTRDEYVRYSLMTGRGSVQEGCQTLHRTKLLRLSDYALSRAFNSGLVNLYSSYFYVPALILLHGDMYIIRETLSSGKIERNSYSLKFNQSKLQSVWLKLLKMDGYKINPFLYIWARFMIFARSTARRAVFWLLGDKK